MIKKWQEYGELIILGHRRLLRLRPCRINSVSPIAITHANSYWNGTVPENHGLQGPG